MNYLRIYLLCISVFGVYSKFSEEWLDKAVVMSTGMSLPDEPFSLSPIMLRLYCANRSFGDLALKLTRRWYGVSKLPLMFIDQMALAFQYSYKICDTIEHKSFGQISSLLNEIRDKAMAQKEYNHGVYNALVDGSQPNTNFTVSKLNCYVKGWYDSITNSLTGEAREMLMDMLNLIPKYIANSGHPLATDCNWESIPVTNGNKFHSVPLLAIKALTNLDKLSNVSNPSNTLK